MVRDHNDDSDDVLEEFGFAEQGRSLETRAGVGSVRDDVGRETPPVPVDSSTWDEILGHENYSPNFSGTADTDEILRSLNNNSEAWQKLVAARLAGNRPVVRKLPLARRSSINLTFGPLEIGAGVETVFCVAPQRLFRGTKLIVNESIMGATVITNMLVGARNQMPNGFGGVSSQYFGFNNSLGSGIKFDTCQPAHSISIAVRNTSSHPVTWSATLLGDALI